MNKLSFELRSLSHDTSEEIDGINFRNCILVFLKVDDVIIPKSEKDRIGLVVLEEVKKARSRSGQFLILTCACGIADDGGFDLIQIERNDKSVCWKFLEESSLEFTFNREQHDSAIDELLYQLSKISLPIEPVNHVFPEI